MFKRFFLSVVGFVFGLLAVLGANFLAYALGYTDYTILHLFF
jgi:hypothetical protein